MLYSGFIFTPKTGKEVHKKRCFVFTVLDGRFLRTWQNYCLMQRNSFTLTSFNFCLERQFMKGIFAG